MCLLRVILQLVPEEVVHVHDLRPPLLVPDLVLVLQVADDRRLARQHPHQPTAVRRRVLVGRGDLHVAVTVPLLALMKNDED